MTRSVPLITNVPFMRHQRHVAHVDVLLLHVLDGLGTGFFVDVEHDQAQLDLQRRRIGHVALHALVDVVLRWLEFVMDEFQRRPAREIGDRKDRLKTDCNPASGRPPSGSLTIRKSSYELFWTSIRFGIRATSWILPNLLADTSAAVEGFSHVGSSSSFAG